MPKHNRRKTPHTPFAIKTETKKTWVVCFALFKRFPGCDDTHSSFKRTFSGTGLLVGVDLFDLAFSYFYCNPHDSFEDAEWQQLLVASVDVDQRREPTKGHTQNIIGTHQVDDVHALTEDPEYPQVRQWVKERIKLVDWTSNPPLLDEPTEHTVFLRIKHWLMFRREFLRHNASGEVARDMAFFSVPQGQKMMCCSDYQTLRSRFEEDDSELALAVTGHVYHDNDKCLKYWKKSCDKVVTVYDTQLCCGHDFYSLTDHPEYQRLVTVDVV